MKRATVYSLALLGLLLAALAFALLIGEYGVRRARDGAQVHEQWAALRLETRGNDE